MPRSTVRSVALFVLVLLGVPVAMHVVLHDLHDHHHADAGEAVADSGHGDHEHPIVGTSTPAATRLARTALPIVTPVVTQPIPASAVVTGERNVLSPGALRSDADVDRLSLLSTFLI